MFLKKISCPIRILYLFIKSFVNLFVDIASNFFDSSITPFLASTCFVLFEFILLLKLNSLLPKSVLFTKLAISFLPAKFACFDLAVKLSAVNLLDS